MIPRREEIIEWFESVTDRDRPGHWTAQQWAAEAKPTVAPSNITRLLKYREDEKKAPTPKPDTLEKLARANPPVAAPSSWGLLQNLADDADFSSTSLENGLPIIELSEGQQNNHRGSSGLMRERLIAQIVYLLPVVPTDILAEVHGHMAIEAKKSAPRTAATKSRP